MKRRPSAFSNERSVASAGSGKTYSLTNRFIALACSCDPESICALTFTRMAAAEFLDKILTKLAAAASDASYAGELGVQIAEISGGRPLHSGDFADILERVTRVLPRLNLSTIDAFEARFVSAFSTELGIAGRLKIMDDYEKERARRAVLDALLGKLSRDSRMLSRFVGLVNAASFGRTQRSVYGKIGDYVRQSQGMFAQFPYPERWGALKKSPCKIKPAVWDAEEYGLMLRRLELLLAGGGVPKKASELFTFLKNSRLGGIAKGSKLVAALFEFMRGGGAVRDFDFGGGARLPREAAETAQAMLNMLSGASFAAACESAAAVGKIARAYEAIYSREVRLRGSLAFEDLTCLLADSSLRVERSLAEYRMDARFKHWMIDEFQDTSRAQWSALENLIDEVFADESGERTFYCVGDPKQSIYAWRGGAPELFDEIFEKYSGYIREGARLNVSRRSVRPVIDAVNALFSSRELANFNPAAARAWLDRWEDHVSHSSLGSVGCAALVRRDADADIVDQIYEIIKCVFGQNSSGKNLSCAVLVQTNALVESVVEGLRGRIMRDCAALSVAGEVENSIADDNMVVPAVLKLLHAAAHPSDTASAAYVKMTPLAPYASGQNWHFEILERVACLGFEGFVREVGKFLDSVLPESDAFSRRRLSLLRAAAAEFDSRGGIDEFVEYAASRKSRESSKPAAIRVMTIHKSKGLDFDAVILPQLENTRGHEASLRLADASDGGKIVMSMPPEAVCRMDASLNAEFEKMASDNAMARICKFYVGATRAKRAVYFLSEWFDGGKKSVAKYSFERHVYDALFDGDKVRPFAGTLACEAFGSLDWAAEVPPKAEVSRRVEIPALEDSHRADFSAGLGFSDSPSEGVRGAGATAEGRIFGTCAHRILERIEFIGGSVSEAVSRASYGLRFGAEVLERARECVERALSVPEVRALFLESEGLVCFREFPYAVSEEGRAASGRIDRINVFYSADGRPRRAEVIEFKTDGAGLSDSEMLSLYSAQLESYKKAASLIFPEAQIECALVNVARAKVLRPGGER